MKLMETTNLFYPDARSAEYAARRRKMLRNYPDFFDDLEAKRLAVMLLPQNPDRVLWLMSELNDDPEVLSYRLDCLEDFLRQPKLSDTFRNIIRRISDNNKQLDLGSEKPNSFTEIRMRMDNLQIFMDCIAEINSFGERCGHSIKSSAMNRLMSFFRELPSQEKYREMANDLSQLQQIFSKTIRSVKIGINFTHNMTPDTCGILEVSSDKIYPKGNVLDRLIFKTYQHSEQFSGEEHLNTATHDQSPDMDTALFRELDSYTKEFSRRIAAALKNYRDIFFSDINELEHQLDFYDGAVNLIEYVRARGLEMCRPVLAPKEERRLMLKDTFDLCFFRQISSADYKSRGEKLCVTNDIYMDRTARFYMITGANNGGKTTFARGVGICQLLAQTGLYVPGTAAELSPVDHIFTHFPKEEEVGINSSRFTTEIKQLKEICDLITPYSMVIMNESIQSTTPDECLEIAGRHLEILAAAGVRGMYVTHLVGLYTKAQELNEKGYSSKIGSLVSKADKASGKRLYKISQRPPLKESLAYTVYDNFGARLEDVVKRLGGVV